MMLAERLSVYSGAMVCHEAIEGGVTAIGSRRRKASNRVKKESYSLSQLSLINELVYLRLNN